MNAHVMQIMDPTGHTEITWNPEDADEVRMAREMFESMRERGHSIFRINPNGNRGARVTTFDPEAEKLLVVPQLVGG